MSYVLTGLSQFLGLIGLLAILPLTYYKFGNISRESNMDVYDFIGLCLPTWLEQKTLSTPNLMWPMILTHPNMLIHIQPLYPNLASHFSGSN